MTRHYGFGAARVRLCAVPHFVPAAPPSFWRDAQQAGPDFLWSSLPALVLVVIVAMCLTATLSRDRADLSDIEIVMFEAEAPVIPDPEPDPIPEPDLEIAKVEPPPPVVEPKVAVKKPPKPKPKPLIELAKPPAPPVVARAPKLRPAPPTKRAAPRPQIDSVALAKPAPRAPPAPVRRASAPQLAAAKPKIDLAPLAGAPALDASEPAPPPRRFASVRAPTRRLRTRVAPAPIAARTEPIPSEVSPPASRSRRQEPKAGGANRAPRLAFGASPPSAPAAPAVGAPRRSRVLAAPDRSRRARPAPAAALAQPSLRASAPVAPAAPSAYRLARTSAPEGPERSLDPSLAGVPLASLAVCVSEREEDALKRRLVAAVKAQRECASRAGNYRFVETKNLNAFLMTIERAPSRVEADRCVELRHALECVTR